MTTEDLHAFIEWLSRRDIWLVTGMDNALSPEEVAEQIEEYHESTSAT